MSEHELRIAKISALLNSAIRSKNSKDYKAALSMLEKCNPKPSLSQIIEAQEQDNKKHQDEIRIKQLMSNLKSSEKALKEINDNQSVKNIEKNPEEMTINELEQELANLRKEHGDEIDNVELKSKEEIEEEEEKRIQDVIKRYEKTFGRIKDLGSYRPSTGSVTGKSIVSSQKSKNSKATELSTASQREAFEKLKKLNEEEEKIKKEKEDLMKFLELRSQSSKTTSRPVTVSSILSRTNELNQSNDKNELPIIRKKQEKTLEKIPEQLEKPSNKEKFGNFEKKNKKDPDNLSELFKNL